ncbi:MAG: hypothetical protein M1816_002613 [Peltula sp. TS41687]|nr:MAG: hypothetical protein M1816_002613 [Peltula sp. TS41687]
MFGQGATYDSIQGRFQKVKADAATLSPILLPSRESHLQQTELTDTVKNILEPFIIWLSTAKFVNQAENDVEKCVEADLGNRARPILEELGFLGV